MKPRKRTLKRSHPEGMAPGLRQRKLRTSNDAPLLQVRIVYTYLGAKLSSEVVHVKGAADLYRSAMRRMPDDDGYGMTLEATELVLIAIKAERVRLPGKFSTLHWNWKHKDLELIAEEI